MAKINEKAASGLRVFESWVESQMAYRGQPGLSAAVIHDQEVVWSKGFGYADVENGIAAAHDIIYRVASISKLFTSTALMQLKEKGKLNLFDPVRDYLPWFDIKDEKGPISLVNLVTHTSGLPREAAGPYWTTNQFPETEELIKNLPGQTHTLPVWRKWKYSNLAVSLAGMIVEEVAGKRYEDYVKENVLDPLGMSDSFMETIPMGHPKLAKGYGRRLPDGSRQASDFTDCKGITPAANLATTVMDLAKFAMLQFREDQEEGVLRGETLREMHRPHWVDPKWTMGWGIGFSITRLNGKTYIGHGGAVKGYRTNLRISLDDKVAVIVFTNADDGEPIKYVDKAFPWVAHPLAGKPSEVKPIDESWRDYIGKYRSDWRDAEVLEYNGGLIIVTPNLPDPLLEPTKLDHINDNRFKMIASGYGSHGEEAVFERDESGKVYRLVTGENYAEKIESW
ncbi:MAG: serine hydrolase [Candidatus Bathyarchaeia archaeon]